MKSLALIPLFALFVAAQQNPLIPASISTGCSTFLISLNTDADLTSCTKALLGATSAFSPTAQGNATADSLKSTLNTLCSTTTAAACKAPSIRAKLSLFYNACTDELTRDTPNEIVLTTFDILYTLSPFKDAVCSKNSSGQYCVLNMGATSSAGTSNLAATATAGGSSSGNNAVSHNLDPLQLAAVKLAQSKLLVTVHTDADYPNGIGAPPEKRDLIDARYPNGLGAPAPAPRDQAADSAADLLRRTQAEAEIARRAQDVTALMANSTTFRVSNLMFLFVLPTLSADKMCTDCTAQVLTAYMSWEQDTPYPMTLSKSPLLGDEEDLWNAISSTCGPDFASGVLNAAGANPTSAGGTSAATIVEARGAAMFAAVGAALLALVAL